MSLITTAGVTGLDNVSPIYEENSRWCYWNLNEIYSWTTNNLDGNRNTRVGTNKYVPKIGDYVNDTVNNITYVVIDMDITDLTVTLKEVAVKDTSVTVSSNDVLLGISGGSINNTYRIYLDKTVLPFSLAVDARLKVGGSLSNYAKIFKGSDISNTGTVISRLYDQSGNFLTENIPLEVVTYDTYQDPALGTVTINNNSIKVVSVCHTQYDLKDGEIATVVIYNDQAGVVSKQQLLIENTSFIRTLNASQKYITGISLETPFLSQTNSDLIEYPVNLPISSLAMMGVVHYSDGTKIKLPVDGTKFSMLGINQYISTVPGQRLDLVLTYNLSPIETVIAPLSSNGKTIPRAFSLVTSPVDNVYNVKLFGYPKFINNQAGFAMVWYLYNLDRNVVFDVTGLVKFNANTGAFNPTLFGSLQRLSVSINLRDVSGIYKSYVHTQTIDITLYDRPTSLTTSWTIGFTPNQLPAYGVGLFATVKNIDVNNRDINLTTCLNFNSTMSADDKFAMFIDKFINQTKPLYNVNKELGYPAPTHFTIVSNSIEHDYPIASWNTVLRFNSVITEYDTLIIKFYKETTAGKIHISAAGIEARFIS